MIPKNIKIRYIVDYREPDRVMTLVTRKEDDGKVSYAYSINQPTRWVSTEQTTNTQTIKLVKGDRFKRATGREMAMSRLTIEPATLELAADQNAYELVLRHLAASQIGAAKRMARAALSEFETLQRFKAALFQYQESMQKEQN